MQALTADWLQARAAVRTGGHLAGRPGGRIHAACVLRVHSEEEQWLRLHPATGWPSGNQRLLAERRLLDRVHERQMICAVSTRLTSTSRRRLTHETCELADSTELFSLLSIT